MGTPFLAEIRAVSFVFAPRGWALCNGQFMPINQNQALFSLLGTTYGGDGQTTFALPDLRGRTPISTGNGHSLGERGGEAAHTLNQSEMPAHRHPVGFAARATTTSPAGAHFAATGKVSFAATANTQLNASAVGFQGGSQPHENMPPYLTLNYVIALQGIFPSQN